jgi:hypothetical protein
VIAYHREEGTDIRALIVLRNYDGGGADKMTEEDWDRLLQRAIK